MRRTSPSNRIAGYFREPQNLIPQNLIHVVRPSVWHPEARPRRGGIPTVHRLGGPAAGIMACLLQLAASTLCVAAAISSWLGHPIPVSTTTMVLLGGAVFGASSGLLLYNFVVSAAIASASTRDIN
jgi:hypothetical protein